MSATADREIVTERLIDAPRALVWKVWTDPAHLVKWWGPDGFTNTFEEIAIRPGGEWKFIMHGPDGVNYPNYVRFEELRRPERIVYIHGERPDDPTFFKTTVTFEAAGTKTKITMRAVFPTKEAREFVIKHFKADVGAQQHLGRMADAIAALAPADAQELVITRVFDAAPDLVWRAWTEPEHFRRWWGPATFTCPVCDMDVRPGGAFRWAMRWPDGRDNWNAGRFTEVVPKTRLAYVIWFADAAGTKIHPSAAANPGEWPGDEMACSVDLTPVGNRTQMVLRHRGLPDMMMGDAVSGWATSLDKLAASL